MNKPRAGVAAAGVRRRHQMTALKAAEATYAMMGQRRCLATFLRLAARTPTVSATPQSGSRRKPIPHPRLKLRSLGHEEHSGVRRWATSFLAGFRGPTI